MFKPIPAPGYKLISGKRSPPKDVEAYYCQLRNGWCDSVAWPTATTRFIHDGTAGDVVAVKPK